MTRKTDGRSSGAARSAGNVKSLRSAIDKLDIQILKMVNQRASLAAQIGKLKNDQGSDVFSPVREDEVLTNVVQANRGPLDANTIRAVFREIMSGSRALQKIVKIAYLGPEYSFSHLAAVERFGQSVEFIKVGSVAAVFEEVNRGHAEFGVVPLENSTDGRVADTMEMFIRLPQLTICAEVPLPIHHNLLANCEQQEIRRVYSKPQALSQCRTWISKNVPHASLHEVASTATAAELAQREPGAAAIASRQAAVRYGLRVLFTNIEDAPNNLTRFAVIGHHKAERTGHDKTAIMMRVNDQPGALVSALDAFKSAKINLTWIESFPAPPSPKPESVFFIDFEGHQEDPKIAKVLKQLHDHAKEVTVLGSFKMEQVPEEEEGENG
jgi:chorismate mutase/prephenate dehydratase